MCVHLTAYVEVIAQKLQTFVALSCDYGVLNHLSFTMAVCEDGLFSWRVHLNIYLSKTLTNPSLIQTTL